MPERTPVTDSSELLHRISRLSSEAAWTPDELRDVLRAGGVDPDRLVSRVMTEVTRLLEASPAPGPTTLRPLLGSLQQQTNLPPSAIATAMDVSVTFLSAVSRYAQVVPDRWRRELATRAERAWRIERRIVMESLTQPFQHELAASRDTPYSAEAVRSYEDILDRSSMSSEVQQFWRALAQETSP